MTASLDYPAEGSRSAVVLQQGSAAFGHKERPQAETRIRRGEEADPYAISVKQESSPIASKFVLRYSRYSHTSWRTSSSAPLRPCP